MEKTNGIYLYLSLVPKINIEGVNVIALSPQSPLGNKLMECSRFHLLIIVQNIDREEFRMQWINCLLAFFFMIL
jgi:hypothetical protein